MYFFNDTIAKQPTIHSWTIEELQRAYKGQRRQPSRFHQWIVPQITPHLDCSIALVENRKFTKSVPKIVQRYKGEIEQCI